MRIVTCLVSLRVSHQHDVATELPIIFVNLKVDKYLKTCRTAYIGIGIQSSEHAISSKNAFTRVILEERLSVVWCLSRKKI